MRIVHWDEMFHPTYGYQINVLAKYQAMQGHDVIIMTSERIEDHPVFSGLYDCDVLQQDREYSEKYHVQIIRLPIYRTVSSMVIFKPGFIKKIKELKPDVLMCHFNDTVASMWIAWAYKRLNVPIVFDNHMLEMAAVNPLHKAFTTFFRITTTPLIVKNRWTVIRTQNDPYVYDAYRIPLEQAPFISFGSDMLLFHPDAEERKRFREQNGIPQDAFVIVYTGKLGGGKGGKLLAETLRERFRTDREVVAVIVGTSRSEYEREVDRIFGESENRIIRFDAQKYTELPQFYQAADLFVLAKQCSLSFFDAQACGLPAVVEDNNVNTDRVSHGNGYAFHAGDIRDFRENIETCINMNEEQYRAMRQAAHDFVEETYNYASISEQYTRVMEAEIEKLRKH